MHTDPPTARHARIFVLLEPFASLTLLESRSGGEAALMNVGAEIILEPNARLHHIRLAASAPDAIQVEEIAVRVGRTGCYKATLLQQGAKLSRVALSVLLGDEGAETCLSGVSLLAGDLHADLTTRIDHAKGRTISRQLFKKVVAGNARAIYQGKIAVHKGADGSDSRQTAKAILLGGRAEADLKPELEILADDVKCAHGAAIGDLDADSLFYLRSRGLPETEARTLLIRGFLEEAIADIDRDDVRAAAWQFLDGGLGALAEARA
jgi:Fe-S cluster assembly protein SufD